MLSSLFSVKLLKFVKLSPYNSLVLCKYEKLTRHFDFCSNTWKDDVFSDKLPLFNIFVLTYSTSNHHCPFARHYTKQHICNGECTWYLASRTFSLVARDIPPQITCDLSTLKWLMIPGYCQTREANQFGTPGTIFLMKRSHRHSPAEGLPWWLRW